MYLEKATSPIPDLMAVIPVSPIFSPLRVSPMNSPVRDHHAIDIPYLRRPERGTERLGHDGPGRECCCRIFRELLLEGIWNPIKRCGDCIGKQLGDWYDEVSPAIRRFFNCLN